MTTSKKVKRKKMDRFKSGARIYGKVKLTVGTIFWVALTVLIIILAIISTVKTSGYIKTVGKVINKKKIGDVEEEKYHRYSVEYIVGKEMHISTLDSDKDYTINQSIKIEYKISDKNVIREDSSKEVVFLWILIPIFMIIAYLYNFFRKNPTANRFVAYGDLVGLIIFIILIIVLSIIFTKK